MAASLFTGLVQAGSRAEAGRRSGGAALRPALAPAGSSATTAPQGLGPEGAGRDAGEAANPLAPGTTGAVGAEAAGAGAAEEEAPEGAAAPAVEAPALDREAAAAGPSPAGRALARSSTVTTVPSRCRRCWPAVTTLSPASSPSRISTLPGLRRPTLTSTRWVVRVFSSGPASSLMTNCRLPCGTMASSGITRALSRTPKTVLTRANMPGRSCNWRLSMQARMPTDRPFASISGSIAWICALYLRPGSASISTIAV